MRTVEPFRHGGEPPKNLSCFEIQLHGFSLERVFRIILKALQQAPKNCKSEAVSWPIQRTHLRAYAAGCDALFFLCSFAIYFKPSEVPITQGNV